MASLLLHGFVPVILTFLLPRQENLFSSLVFGILQRNIHLEISLVVHNVVSWVLPVEDRFG